MKHLAFLFVLSAALVLGLFRAPTASAVGPCLILQSGTTQTLQNDCTTESSILIPDGVTFDGGGHTITAVDPGTGHFLGAVVRNAPVPTGITAQAFVTNVKIEGLNLVDACDPGSPTDTRLRGILFERAGGVISNNQVTNLRQGTGAEPSGCQEGNAIEVRNEPFEKSSNKVLVTISDNRVVHYQKTGIAIIGSVDASIHRNFVEGFGPISTIAQNGIQVSFGATAAVTANEVFGNNYTPPGTTSCGILIFQADGVRQQNNLLHDNEKNTCVDSKGGTYDPYGNGQAH